MTDHIPPLSFTWDGEVMTPVIPRRADQYYVVGEHYRLVPHEERSMRSHRHYFASLKESYDNLPIGQQALWSTVEHYRKHLLIKTGYRKERSVICETEDEARKLERIIGGYDQYAWIKRTGNIVTIWTAESQSTKAMGRERFQESKWKVLDEAAAMIGVTRADLERNRAA